jgi:hypothetical protein
MADRPDQFTECARSLIEAKLLNHPDDGVRAITAMFGVPDEAVEAVAAKLRAEAAALAEMPDDEIDCSDIPETTDWSGAVRGRFAASGTSGSTQDAQRLDPKGAGPVGEAETPNHDNPDRQSDRRRG